MIKHSWTQMKVWNHLKDDQKEWTAPELNSVTATGLNTYIRTM